MTKGRVSWHLAIGALYLVETFVGPEFMGAYKEWTVDLVEPRRDHIRAIVAPDATLRVVLGVPASDRRVGIGPGEVQDILILLWGPLGDA